MATPSKTRGAGPIDITELRRLVFDEFKLVQEKIDRIGEFLFKIRAWSITANSGIIVAVLSIKLTPISIVVGAVATYAFWRLEKHQRGLRDGYSDRAVALEAAMTKLLSTHPKVTPATLVEGVVRRLHQVPGIAHSSRRDFIDKPARETREDELYKVQFGILLLAFVLRLVLSPLTQIYHSATALGGLALTRFLEMISCG